jgi:hypothetical protein
MYNKKMLFMPHLPTPGGGVEDDPGRTGSGKTLNIWILYIKGELYLHCLGKLLKGKLLRLGCTFNSKWKYLNHNSICTTGQVLKINNIYTYKEESDIDIVRLTDVHVERGYLYCSLFFFSKNKIITVCQTLKKDATINWRLMANEEFDERMSMKLWRDVENSNKFSESESYCQ